MKNQHFQSSVFAAFLFEKLISVLLFHCTPLLKSLPFWRARFASFGSIFGVIFYGLGNILAPKTLQEAFLDASKKNVKF